MAVGLIGIKYGMTRIIDEGGAFIPVTVIGIENNRIAQIKTLLNDGYGAIQVAYGTKPASRVNKPMAGHYSKAGIEGGMGVHEFRLSEEQAAGYTLGQPLTVEVFQAGQAVDVSAISKGKGFAGVIKKYNFRTQDASHGNSLSHRALGSTGMNQSPGRVFKGKKMPGQMGNVQKTVQNQIIAGVDLARGLLLVKGVVPGAPGGRVIILPSVKNRGENAHAA